MSETFALVGCGRIGKKHAAEMSNIGNLVAVCDILPERADDIANKYGAVAYYNIEDLLRRVKDISVAAICTPNGLHAPQSIACLQAGMHVLCEKPLCITVASGREMIDAAHKADRKLLVVKQNRYNPPVKMLRELLTSGRLGRVSSFQLNCFWNRDAAYYTGWRGTKALDGGILFTQFSHFIDLLQWTLGDVADVKRFAANFMHRRIEIEDCGVVALRLKSGALGTLNYTVNSYEKNMEGSFTVFGENGTVKIGGQYLNELEYFNVRGMKAPALPKGNMPNDYGFYEGSMSNHHRVYAQLAAALAEGTAELPGAADGLKTVEIIEKIYSQP